MFSNVIVGIDGGPGGRDALALARHLADGHAEITLAHVYVESPIATRAESSELEAAERERSAELLEEARAAAGIYATLNPARSRSVGRGLHELAERVGADLIVVGSSSRGLISRTCTPRRRHACLTQRRSVRRGGRAHPLCRPCISADRDRCRIRPVA